MDLRCSSSPSKARRTTTSSPSPGMRRGPGFEGFFRSDHFLLMGRRTPATAQHRRARAHRRLDHAGRAAPARPSGSGSAPCHLRRPSASRASWPSRSPVSTPCPAAGSSSAWAPAGSRPSTRRTACPSRDVRERFDRLEEQLAIVTGLWATAPGERYRHDGPALPAGRLAGPAQAGPDAAPDHRRGPRQAAHARARRQLRARVQRRRSHRRPRWAAARRGRPGGLPGGRPRAAAS